MSMKFGLTQEFSCSYLEGQQEQLLVLVSDAPSATSLEYNLLLEAGFRRSGDQVYRPHCGSCQACQSIRVPVADFVMSKSQKRINNKNADILVNFSKVDKAKYYSLYEQYINDRHQDSSMFPASRAQYDNFINCGWLEIRFIEFHYQETLIGVAVTDVLKDGLSALYTFFKPEFSARSLGTFAILKQIEESKRLNKPFLYLGYQIDECQKMRYKANFHPHQRFIGHKWQLITK